MNDSTTPAPLTDGEFAEATTADRDIAAAEEAGTYTTPRIRLFRRLYAEVVRLRAIETMHTWRKEDLTDEDITLLDAEMSRRVARVLERPDGKAMRAYLIAAGWTAPVGG